MNFLKAVQDPNGECTAFDFLPQAPTSPITTSRCWARLWNFASENRCAVVERSNEPSLCAIVTSWVVCMRQWWMVAACSLKRSQLV